jgi:hypothetical protein
MTKLLATTAILLALAGNALAQSEDNQTLTNTSYPSYGDIAYGIGSVWWGWIVGLNGGYSGSGNRCNCSVGGSGRAQ